MYDFDFDPETNGIELSWRDTGGEIPRREARPVSCIRRLYAYFRQSV